jgi:hypothetical protein
MKWKKYYYRVVGFLVGGAGAGLVLDELIHGPFNLAPGNHEFFGLIMIVVGGVFISLKPHGKD